MALTFGRTSTGLLVPVLVDASGYLYINTVSTITTLPAISLAANQNIQARNHGYVSGAWQKDPIGFGYSGAVRRSFSNTSLAAGSNTVNDSAVPAGEIWIINSLSAAYVGTVTNVVLELGISSGGTLYSIYGANNLTSGLYVDREGFWIMAPGENLYGYIANATLNNDFYGFANGFRVDIDL